MYPRGKHYLRITGILEILIGVGSFALIFWILNQDIKEFVGIEFNMAEKALWSLVLIYGTAAFQILAGIVGFLLAGNVRDYKLHYFFGMTLILLGMGSIINTGSFDMASIMRNVLVLLVPSYYLFGAMKNKQSYEGK